MRNNNRFTLTLTLIFVLLTIITLLLAQRSSSESMPEYSTSLTEVDSKYVCMVTDKLFYKEQIAVEVADKTYYGCCEMCKARLRDNPTTRISKDPVSGKIVDKADSVIGASGSGNVYYFESKENLNKFAGK